MLNKIFNGMISLNINNNLCISMPNILKVMFENLRSIMQNISQNIRKYIGLYYIYVFAAVYNSKLKLVN